MLNAEEFAMALVENDQNQWYVVGLPSDIQRLADAGAVSRAWDIRMDNGHRPYPVIKKRIHFDIVVDCTGEPKNALTQRIEQAFNVSFAANFYDVTKTYLFRPTAAFWADLFIAFADEQGRILNINPNNYYAVYRGHIMPSSSGIKFIRLEANAISKTVFPALS